MKRTMRIKAPANSFRVAKGQIDLGADEIYLGVDFDDFANISYTGRGRCTWRGKKCHIEGSELKDIIQYAHEKGSTVSYACNSPILYEEIESGFLKYVEFGVEAGVDSIIVGSLEGLMLLNEHPFDIKYVAGVFTECYNHEFVQILKDLRAKEVYLPHHLKVAEIKEMVTAHPDMEFGVFAHFGCSNSNGSCFLYHQAGESINVGLPCRGKYRVMLNGREVDMKTVIDAGTDCAICSVKDLYEAGVRSLKIVGRDKDLNVVGSLTKIYRLAMDLFLEEGCSKEEVRKIIAQKMPLIEMENCSLGRCKYETHTEIVRSFI